MTEKILQDLLCTGLVTVILVSVLKLARAGHLVAVGLIVSLSLMLPYNLLYSQVFAHCLWVAGPMSYLQMAVAWEAGWLIVQGECLVEKLRVYGWTGLLTTAAVVPSIQEVGGWDRWGYAEVRGLAQAVTFIMLLAMLCSDQVGQGVLGASKYNHCWTSRQSAKLLCCWMAVRLIQTRAYILYARNGNGDEAWVLARWVYVIGLAAVAYGYFRLASNRPDKPKLLISVKLIKLNLRPSAVASMAPRITNRLRLGVGRVLRWRFIIHRGYGLLRGMSPMAVWGVLSAWSLGRKGRLW